MRIIKAEDFHKKLRDFDITLIQACELIHQKTGAIISSKHVHTQIDRYAKLSEPQSAAFVFLFRELGANNE